MNMKQLCAKEALKYINDGMCVGLGGGSTVGYLAEYLAKEEKKITVVTPSDDTAELCKNLGLIVLSLEMTDHIDIAFDGCDELDKDLNALKANGAIHTKEKIIASMAEKYVLLIDESKFYDTLPLKDSVTLEVIPQSKNYVQAQIEKLGGKAVMRKSGAKAGFVISDNGNYIMDTDFSNVAAFAGKPEELHQKLKQLTGVVETALFIDVVAFTLCVCGEQVKVIEK